MVNFRDVTKFQNFLVEGPSNGGFKGQLEDKINDSFGDLFDQIEQRTFAHFDPSVLINYGCYGFYFSDRPQVRSIRIYVT